MIRKGDRVSFWPLLPSRTSRSEVAVFVRWGCLPGGEGTIETATVLLPSGREVLAIADSVEKENR